MQGNVSAKEWDSYFKYAEELEDIGFNREAAGEYREIAGFIWDKDSTNDTALAKAYFGEGRCWESLKKDEDALMAYMKVAYIYKGNLEARAWYRIGYIFEERLKMEAKAKEIYQRLQQKFPNDPAAGDSLFQSAKLAEQDKLFEEAITIYTKNGIKEYPKHEKADKAPTESCRN